MDQRNRLPSGNHKTVERKLPRLLVLHLANGQRTSAARGDTGDVKAVGDWIDYDDVARFQKETCQRGVYTATTLQNKTVSVSADNVLLTLHKRRRSRSASG